MSNGATHDNLTKQLYFPSLLLTIPIYFITKSILAVILFIVFYSIGVFIQRLATPDTDVNDGHYGFYIAKKHFGWFGWFWEYYWKPYSLLVGHRSWVSHTFILSAIIRLLYISPLFFYLWPFFFSNWDLLLYLLLGIIISDLGHYILDFIYPFRYWYESHFSS